MMNSLRSFMLTTLICLLASCANPHRDPAQDSLPAAVPAMNLSELPSILELHQTAAIVPLTLTADGYLKRSNNSVVNGTVLELAAPVGETCFGIWQFNPAADTLVSLEIQGSIDLGSQAYVAIADYSNSRWEFFGPYDAFQVISLDNAKQKSGLNNFFCAVLTVDGNAASVEELVCSIDQVPVNQPPVASLIGDADEGNPGLVVHFDATGSLDPDGSIVDYEWDLDDDGNYNEPGEEAASQGQPNAEFTYAKPRVYRASVRVTDNSADSAIAQFPLLIHGWADLNLDENTAYAVIAVVAGTPCIAYTKSAVNSQLKYARSLTETGGHPDDWTRIVILDEFPDYPTRKVLAVIDGKPCISYWDQDAAAYDLHYAYSGTSTGNSASDWQVIALTNPNECGGMNWLAQLSTFPAIAYQTGNPDWHLAYRVSSTSLGNDPGDWTSILVDARGVWAPQLVYNSLGNPCIKYSVEPDYTLDYAYSSTASGDSALAWEHLNIDPAAGSGDYASLAIIEGVPMIAYQSGGVTLDLNYAYCDLASGADIGGSWHTFALQTTGDVGAPCSLVNLNGVPAIVYFDDTNKNLLFTKASTAGGRNPGEWSAPEIIMNLPLGLFNNEISFTSIYGNPAVVFLDADQFLHYLVLL